ncbi:SLBB domain-containing protein [Aeromonas veronii]|uniref:SLBB domain-containing protein n=1 Tax=Aeromonas veronii TaxID=654 RepID=UPI001F1A6DFA|nr:SLBB domain-containing protein [Aeromonas veronii]MCF5846466.1 SLBB domain-containing protein [Aeromonas veronii]
MSVNKLKQSVWLLSLALLGSAVPAAPQITPEMMAKFKQLSPAQQQALAAQYGIDPSQLGASAAVSSVTPVNTAPVAAPRDVDYSQPSQRPLMAGVAQEGELQPFGYNVFAGEPLTDAPVVDMPVADDYVLGPGDELRVQLYGKENANYTLPIGREGFIDFPTLGPIAASGQTFQQLRSELESRIKEQKIGVEAFVSFGALRTMQVFVMGDAYRPGAYNVNGLATVTQALQAAGGIDTVGSLRKIQVKRAGQKVIDVDLYKMLVWGDTSQDIRLRSGDTVFIPAKGSEVSIDGLVKRPAIYELSGPAALSSVLGLAGGMKASALNEVSVTRYGESGMRVFNLNLLNQHDRQFVVRDGDKVTVKPSTTEYSQAVMVKGAVVRDGAFSFQPGMRISRILQSASRDLTAAADLNYALVVREVDALRNIEVLQFNLGRALQLPGSDDDLRLQPRDQVLIFSNSVLAAMARPALRGSDTGRNNHGQLASTSDHSVVTPSIDQQQLAQQLQQEQQSVVDSSTGAMVRQGQLTSEKMTLANLATDTTMVAQAAASRQVLLAPVIEKLKAQAAQGKPVQIAEVRGEVKFPGVYPISRVTTTHDLLVAAGGLNEQANVIELSRINEVGDNISIENVRLDLPTANRVLGAPQVQSKDSLNVLPHPQWREEATVQVFGEVKYPGTYTVRRGESLQELIQRVGGITAYANPNGTVFAREALRKQEEERIALLRDELKQEIATMTLRRQSSIANYTSSPAEAMTVVNQLENSKAVGRMTIDMPAILSGDKQADVMLQDGDKLYVPALQNVVSIQGMVQFPSSHVYDGNLSVNDYLSRAGGTKKQADTDRIYVIKANGSVMLPGDSWFGGRKSLEPGDTIVVPVDSDYLDNLSIMTSATQILYQLGVAWNAIK